MGQREGGRKEGIDALFVLLWNQGMSFQSRLGSMKELMARAAPCMRSTLPSCLFAVTSAGSSASNFCRMSYSRHRCQSTRSIPGNRIFKGYEEIRGQTDLLTTAELGSVDGDEEGLDAALLGVLHELLCDFAVLVDVPGITVRTHLKRVDVDLDLQLEELHLARLSGVNQLVKCTRSEGWDLHMRQ